MSDAVITKTSPYVIELKPGMYWRYRCGRSENQPFCDGSHKNTGLPPAKFEIKEQQNVALCGCKRNTNKPFCDGTRNTLG